MVAALKRLSPDDAYHNYDAALTIHALLADAGTHIEIPCFFRQAIKEVVEHMNLWWRRFCLYGRDRVKSALTLNELQRFEAAGLLTETPTPDIREWWDSLQQIMRSEREAGNLLQGREAEQLSIEHETHRLSELGIANRPRWVALDDNTAGYDIHSFDKGPLEPVAKLIEVKSCWDQSSKIFLTRNEWETAVEMGSNYWFHVWILPDKRLVEFRASDVERHIPTDRGEGVWQVARVPLVS